MMMEVSPLRRGNPEKRRMKLKTLYHVLYISGLAEHRDIDTFDKEEAEEALEDRKSLGYESYIITNDVKEEDDT